MYIAAINQTRLLIIEAFPTPRPDQPGFIVLVIVREESAPIIRQADRARTTSINVEIERGVVEASHSQTAAQSERVQPTRNLASQYSSNLHQHHHSYTSLLNCLHRNPHS